MDLPERVLVHRVSSRVGPTRLTFSPYSHEQLAVIIKNRLGASAVFQEEAIELCARKVEDLIIFFVGLIPISHDSNHVRSLHLQETLVAPSTFAEELSNWLDLAWFVVGGRVFR